MLEALVEEATAEMVDETRDETEVAIVASRLHELARRKKMSKSWQSGPAPKRARTRAKRRSGGIPRSFIDVYRHRPSLHQQGVCGARRLGKQPRQETDVRRSRRDQTPLLRLDEVES